MNEQIQVCIQVSAGSCERRIYNEKTLELLRTQVLQVPYPYAYGFILETDSGDGGNLDCYVITSEKLAAGAIVTCEPLGLIVQYENDELDYKIIATLAGEERILDDAIYLELKEYMLNSFAQFPGMRIRVGPLQSRQDALDLIQASQSSAEISG